MKTYKLLKNNTIRNFILLSILCVLLAGCGGSKQETTVNISKGTPTIKSLSAEPSTVQTGGGTTISCDATDPDGDLLTYTWAATGGTLSSNSGKQISWTAPTTEGTYTITVMVLDGKNNYISGTTEIKVTNSTTTNNNPAITSGPTANPSTIEPSQTSTITVNASDADSDTLTYSWGASAGSINGSSNTVTYTAPTTTGTYTISVAISDGKGGSVSATTTITVQSSAVTLSSITISTASTSLNTSQTTQFTAVGTYSDTSTADLTNLACWSSSDTSVGTINSSGLFTALSSGTTNVKATKSSIDSNSITITVTQPTTQNQSPTATASATPTTGTAPLTVNFTGSGSDSDGSISKYEWDFTGDGTYDYSSTTTGNTSYIYNTAGTYNTIFRVTDNQGATVSKSVSIIVESYITRSTNTNYSTVYASSDTDTLSNIINGVSTSNCGNMANKGDACTITLVLHDINNQNIDDNTPITFEASKGKITASTVNTAGGIATSTLKTADLTEDQATVAGPGAVTITIPTASSKIIFVVNFNVL